MEEASLQIILGRNARSERFLSYNRQSLSETSTFLPDDLTDRPLDHSINNRCEKLLVQVRVLLGYFDSHYGICDVESE